MTYDWNKMVDITVPTGTNGWVYSGEVIINGVKVKFPVGTPTTVPEPAAALLNKMIELEKEDDLNTARPNNHYIGDVTIPEGKTLTIMKGAKVVDEAGALGGTSGSAPVVILPETVPTYNEDSGEFYILTPWEVDPVVGGVYAVTYNGTTYECKAFAFPSAAMPGAMVMGNAEFMSQLGITDGNPDAPFVLMCLSSEAAADAGGMYGQLIPTDDATPTTISIAQISGASADSGGNTGGSGIFMLHAVAGEKNGTVYACTVDKTYAETAEALASGAYAVCQVSVEGINTWLPIVSREASGAFAFSVTISTITYIFSLGEDDSASLMVLT